MKPVTILALGAVLASAPVHADGVLLVGNKSAASVEIVDLRSGAAQGRIATGEGPHEIEVSPDGRRVVVADYGNAASAGATLTVIDWPSRETRSVPLGEHRRPHGLRFLPDGRRVLVTTEGSGSLVEVDLENGRVLRAIEVGAGKPHMVALAPDGRRAYVTQVAGGVVSVVDLASGRRLRDVATGAGAEGIAITPDGVELWVSNRADDSVSVIDAATLAVVATLPSAGFPIRVAMTPDARHVLVVNAKAATLSVFDRTARRSVASVKLDEPGVRYQSSMLGDSALPIGVRVAPDGRRAYVAISGGDQVAVIDTATWTILERWKTDREPDAVAIAGTR